MDKFRRAREIAPARTDILNNLGIALASAKQLAGATEF